MPGNRFLIRLAVLFGLVGIAIVAAVAVAGWGVGPEVSPESAPTPGAPEIVVGDVGVGSETVGPRAAEADGAGPLTLQESSWLAEQQPLAEVASLAETTWPGDFAYAYFGTPGRDFRIGFAERAPAEVIAALTKTGLRYTVEENAGFTRADYEEATADVVRALKGLAAPGTQLLVGPTPEVAVGSITVSMPGGTGESVARAKRLFDALTPPHPFVLVWAEPPGDQPTASP